MQLRNHPKMTFKGQPNWPPVWNQIVGPRSILPLAEVGVLKEIAFSRTLSDCIYLTIETEPDKLYVGALNFDDAEFAKTVFDRLNRHMNLSLTIILAIDIPD